ncbi:hypothetical protein HTZ84_13780 [Haloterrigena sp. SYSU A558-1]|uniref:Uncharacterized protein n=1 Tax=Haloterrigena gelatinilytica TaxID=2741724 RepID=A0A8J8GMZ9_9EURY|nr:hypothetical protein [Haloterrigena gelatinilytica]NUB90812.1 hypothetical protein [Haloterrigena gelatinilytica]NUC73369.1 hypothetical protein [Haloterrigena gelatinilytica]
MSAKRRGGYVRSATDAVERECDRCEWRAVADAYPELIERYQDHLREEHPTAWLRS